MVTGGVKRQGQWGYRAYKNKDKIGSTMADLHWAAIHVRAGGYVPVYINHVKSYMCRGASASVSVLTVWVCLHAYLTQLLETERLPIKDRRRQTGAGKRRACVSLLLVENQSNQTALHYTLLLTTGRPCSLRGKEDRAAECTTQIIFIWDPGGYWQTGGAFR